MTDQFFHNLTHPSLTKEHVNYEISFTNKEVFQMALIIASTAYPTENRLDIRGYFVNGEKYIMYYDRLINEENGDVDVTPEETVSRLQKICGSFQLTYKQITPVPSGWFHFIIRTNETTEQIIAFFQSRGQECVVEEVENYFVLPSFMEKHGNNGVYRNNAVSIRLLMTEQNLISAEEFCESFVCRKIWNDYVMYETDCKTASYVTY